MARLSSVSSTENNNNNNHYRARSFHATPTASSEASWNSQTGLLANPPGSLGINIKNLSANSNTSSNDDNGNHNNINTSGKWTRVCPKWLIPSRKCPCSGKKSVQVEERIDSKTPRNRIVDLRRSNSSNGTQSQSNPSSFYSTRQNSPTISGSTPQDPINLMANGLLPVSTSISTSTSNGFTFPILEDKPVAVKKMFNVIASNPNQQDPHRDSLEVFQPRSHSSPKSRRASYEDENVSDCSSDLFEIESFSTSTYPRRDSIEEGVANLNPNIKRFVAPPPCRNSLDHENDDDPTGCYAPSEVSIDWSVTTAEGFSLPASEMGYAAMRRGAGENGCGGGGGRKNNGSGGLLSCRCEKAVSVGPGPIKCSTEGGPPNPGRHVGGRPQQQGQFGATAHVSSSSGSGNGNNNKSGLVVMGRSRSSLVPMAFAT